MRSNAERHPRRAGSESDHEDFVRMWFTVTMTSFRIGADFPASWFTTKAWQAFSLCRFKRTAHLFPFMVFRLHLSGLSILSFGQSRLLDRGLDYVGKWGVLTWKVEGEGNVSQLLQQVRFSCSWGNGEVSGSAHVGTCVWLPPRPWRDRVCNGLAARVNWAINHCLWS